MPGITIDADPGAAGVQPGPLTVNEGGSAEYTVVLNTEPTATVILSPASPSSLVGTLGIGSAGTNTDFVTFTSANWSSAQTVTVVAGEDANTDSEMALIVHETAGAVEYGGGGQIRWADLMVNVNDNDPSMLTLAADTLTPSEGGMVTITASLDNRAPTRAGDTTVTLTPSGSAAGGGMDYTLSSTTITIPAAEREGTVTIAIAADADRDDGETIILNASTGATTSPTLTATAITLTITDVLPPGVVSSVSALTVARGAMASYTLVLRALPAAAVTVTVSNPDADALTLGGLSPDNTLTFGTGDWSTPQTVTVSSVQNGEPGDVRVVIGHAAGSTDAGYASLSGAALPSVVVTIRDDAGPPPLDGVSRLLAPELSRLLADGAVGAVAKRIARAGGEAGGVAAAAVARSGGAPAAAGGFASGLSAPTSGAGDGATVASAGAAGAAVSGTRVHRHAQTLAALSEGRLLLAGLAQLLDGSEFVLPLHRARQAGQSGQSSKAPAWLSTLTLWGGGEYRRRENDSGNLNWEADAISARVGLDARIRDHWLLGAALAWGQGTVDDPGVEAGGGGGLQEYRLTLGSVLPYLAWTPQEGVQLWLSGGYGQGTVRLRGEEQSVRSDATQYLATGGARVRLLARGRTRLHVRLEGQGVWLDIDGSRGSRAVAGAGPGSGPGSSQLSAHKVQTRTLRALLEGRRTVVLARGVLTPALEVGVRHDGGDGDTGTGALVGGELRYRGLRGLQAEAGGELLVGRSDYQEWGVWGLVSWEQGADGRGWSLRLSPRYGLGHGPGYGLGSGLDSNDFGSGNTERRLWQQDTAGIAGSGADLSRGASAAPTSASAQLDLRLGYGLAKGRCLLAPYSALSLAGEARRLRLGVQWCLGGQWDLDLAGERLERTGADTAAAPRRTSPEHRILLEGRLRY